MSEPFQFVPLSLGDLAARSNQNLLCKSVFWCNIDCQFVNIDTGLNCITRESPNRFQDPFFMLTQSRSLQRCRVSACPEAREAVRVSSKRPSLSSYGFPSAKQRWGPDILHQHRPGLVRQARSGSCWSGSGLLPIRAA